MFFVSCTLASCFHHPKMYITLQPFEASPLESNGANLNSFIILEEIKIKMKLNRSLAISSKIQQCKMGNIIGLLEKEFPSLVLKQQVETTEGRNRVFTINITLYNDGIERPPIKTKS